MGNFTRSLWRTDSSAQILMSTEASDLSVQLSKYSTSSLLSPCLHVNRKSSVESDEPSASDFKGRSRTWDDGLTVTARITQRKAVIREAEGSVRETSIFYAKTVQSPRAHLTTLSILLHHSPINPGPSQHPLKSCSLSRQMPSFTAPLLLRRPTAYRSPIPFPLTLPPPVSPAACPFPHTRCVPHALQSHPPRPLDYHDGRSR